MLAAATILFALLAVQNVHAHGAITAVTGSNGVTSAAMGIVATTPRDGTKRNPFQQDSSIINDKDIAKGKAGPCGRTLAGGPNDIASEVEAASSAGLPAANADGSVTMTLHQVNGDGAGPYTCEVSTDATGENFQAMTVTTQVPGKNSRSNAKAEDFPLVAQMPAGAACTGGPNGDACIVRCRNGARAGPFGGCAVVTGADTAAAAGNATAAATSAGSAAPATVTVTATAAAAGESSTAAESTTAAVAARHADNFETEEEEAAEEAADEEEEDLKKRHRRRMLNSRMLKREMVGRWI